MAQYLFTFFFYDFTFKIFIILFINKIFETIIFFGFYRMFWNRLDEEDSSTKIWLT